MIKKWEIIHEDEEIIVINKSSGIATESAKVGETDVVSELRKYLKRNGESSYIGVVHRLDQPVEGLLVFGKTKEATAFLSEQVAYKENSKKVMRKEYTALVFGHLPASSGVLTDYLVKEKKNNSARVASEGEDGAQKAILEYKLEERLAETDRVRILLKTGRFHQIRVQLSNINCPIVGDMKYGSGESILYSKENDYKILQLRSDKLAFIHPKTKKEVEFFI